MEITVSELIPATPAEVYKAWLDSAQHSAMTGGKAEVSDKVGGSFAAWDGYITGTNRELIPEKRIIQTWRTTEFSGTDPDSHLEVALERLSTGTRVTLNHTNLPSGSGHYEQGWRDNYFTPMKRYFSALRKKRASR